MLSTKYISDPVESAIGLLNTYPLNNDLSGGLRYPTLKQLVREL